MASRSDAFDEFDDTPDNAFSDFKTDDSSLEDDSPITIELLAGILRSELAKDQAQAPNLSGQAPTPQMIKDASIYPEDAFDLTDSLVICDDDTASFMVPDYARGVVAVGRSRQQWRAAGVGSRQGWGHLFGQAGPNRCASAKARGPIGRRGGALLPGT